jgi:pimeloyl-ACP methyl ester carboxylesterase
VRRPKSTGYVDVGALELYNERHGSGPPLRLLHGAFGTIESCFAGLLPALARRFGVLGVELQGHGRTRGALARLDDALFVWRDSARQQ